MGAVLCEMDDDNMTPSKSKVFICMKATHQDKTAKLYTIAKCFQGALSVSGERKQDRTSPSVQFILKTSTSFSSLLGWNETTKDQRRSVECGDFLFFPWQRLLASRVRVVGNQQLLSLSRLQATGVTTS